MLENDLVTIEAVKNERSYLIKDENKREIGKIEIIEFSNENKCCTFRFKLYKSENSYKYIRYAVSNVVAVLFYEGKLNKVNIIISDNIMLEPFFNINFHIEGVITNNIVKDEKCSNEIILGIDSDTFKKLKNVTALTLKGDKINLRILNLNDANNLLAYYKRNREYLKSFEEERNEFFFTLEGQKVLIRQQYINFLNGNCACFGIFKDNNIIGIIQLYDIVWSIFRNATLGYSLDEKEQGKGYMKEAAKLILNYGFNTLKLHRIEAATLTDNIKSQKILESYGFKRLGLSEKYIMINGNWEDHFIYYKLN